jgi:antirestriction protein ArdC
MKNDVHKAITDQLIATIERGDPLPWVRPWDKRGDNGLPTNAITRKAYQGGNVISLWITARVKGYSSSEWATFKQWQSLSTEDQPVHVRKGEKATLGVFYKPFEKETQKDDGTIKVDRWMMGRAFYVFNRDQVEGLPEIKVEPTDLTTRVQSLDAMIQGLGADVRHGGDQAFYSPSNDYVQMPLRDQFQGTGDVDPTAAYYAILCHELTHWTGHKSRLDRSIENRFGDAGYAVEELVAELGASFVLAEHGLGSPIVRHAAYLQTWLGVLKETPRALFTAASAASKASDYLHQRKAVEAVLEAAE